MEIGKKQKPVMDLEK